MRSLSYLRTLKLYVRSTGHRSLGFSMCFARCNPYSRVTGRDTVRCVNAKLDGPQVRQSPPDTVYGSALASLEYDPQSVDIIQYWQKKLSHYVTNIWDACGALIFLHFLSGHAIFHRLMILWVRSHPRTFCLRVKLELCTSFPE